jgi:hypothetical protein
MKISFINGNDIMHTALSFHFCRRHFSLFCVCFLLIENGTVSYAAEMCQIIKDWGIENHEWTRMDTNRKCVYNRKERINLKESFVFIRVHSWFCI